MKLIKTTQYYYIIQMETHLPYLNETLYSLIFVDKTNGLVVKKLTPFMYSRFEYDKDGLPTHIKKIYRHGTAGVQTVWNKYKWENIKMVYYEDHRGNWYDNDFRGEFPFKENLLLGHVQMINSVNYKIIINTSTDSLPIKMELLEKINKYTQDINEEEI
jgi:hypothetical protein